MQTEWHIAGLRGLFTWRSAVGLLAITATVTAAHPQTRELDARISGVSYGNLIRQIDTLRVEYGKHYSAAQSDSLKQQILSDAGTAIQETLVERIWPAWQGTPWAFNGTSEQPGQGSIACGYFVTTCLRDAGFNLPRVRLAQVASETMIVRIAGEHGVRRYSDTPTEEFLSGVLNAGDGVYLLGLDYHVGFLFVHGCVVEFCHASFIKPWCVTIEPADRADLIEHSRYRVVARIIPDRELTLAWLEKGPVGFDE